MKNVFILPTDKLSSKLIKHKVFNEVKISSLKNLMYWDKVNIYITSDEKSKERDWVTDCEFDKMKLVLEEEGDLTNWKKIILTTDHDLIEDGVQAIDDEFLEWFVKNPSCEFVEVSFEVLRPFRSIDKGYIIHLPDNDISEEPEKLIGEKVMPLDNDDIEEEEETLEDIAENQLRKQSWDTTITLPFNGGYIKGFQQGAEWQAERMYSEKEVFEIIASILHTPTLRDGSWGDISKWFEKNKKK